MLICSFEKSSIRAKRSSKSFFITILTLKNGLAIHLNRFRIRNPPQIWIYYTQKIEPSLVEKLTKKETYITLLVGFSFIEPESKSARCLWRFNIEKFLINRR